MTVRGGRGRWNAQLNSAGQLEIGEHLVWLICYHVLGSEKWGRIFSVVTLDIIVPSQADAVEVNLNPFSLGTKAFWNFHVFRVLFLYFPSCTTL